MFTRLKLAVFVDGCFWHSCPERGSMPNRNRGYWLAKLEANVDRDRTVDAALRASGWSVERLWDHEDVNAVAARIETLVRRAEREGTGGEREQT